MKITAVETLHLSAIQPPFIFVLIHTDEGLTGLAQTADTRTAPVVHDLASRFLLGQDPLQIESLWNTMVDFAGFHGYIEGHGLWSLTSAVAIARALDGLPIHWLEDLLWQDNAEEWADLRAKSPFPIAGSERLFTRHQMRRLLETHGTDVMIGDVTWTGGNSKLKKMATMAEAYGIPFAPHDHSGPVNLWASAHVLLNVPNASIMETTRVFCDPRFGYYHELVEGAPILNDGHMYLPEGPGLGIRLCPEVATRPDATLQRTVS